MAEAATDEGRCADLPGEPAQCFGARGGLGGQEVAELFRQMDQDRARFEYADRHVAAGIAQRGDIRIGVDRDEPAGEMVSLADVSRNGIIFWLTLSEFGREVGRQKGSADEY